MENTTLKLEAPWEQVKELLKEVNTDLTDDDLNYTPGREDELLQHLAQKMGKDKIAVKEWIESVSANKVKAS